MQRFIYFEYFNAIYFESVKYLCQLKGLVLDAGSLTGFDSTVSALTENFLQDVDLRKKSINQPVGVCYYQI